MSPSAVCHAYSAPVVARLCCGVKQVFFFHNPLAETHDTQCSWKFLKCFEGIMLDYRTSVCLSCVGFSFVSFTNPLSRSQSVLRNFCVVCCTCQIVMFLSEQMLKAGPHFKHETENTSFAKKSTKFNPDAFDSDLHLLTLNFWSSSSIIISFELTIHLCISLRSLGFAQVIYI